MKILFRYLIIALLTSIGSFVLGHFAFAKNNAIARLNYADFNKYGNCTATLISKNKALTARHCVTKFSKAHMHLVFGYNRSKWAEHRRIKSIHPHATRDVAILCLDKRSKLVPMKIARRPEPQAIEPILQATTTGYKRSRRHIPTSETCRFQRNRNRARFDCKLEPGMSGAPVIIDGSIVGVVSGTTATFSVVELAVDLPKVKCGK